MPLLLRVLLLTGSVLGSGVSQRVAPDHSAISPIVFHPHFLRARGRPNPLAPPITATIVSNARYRTTVPISSKPAYPSLPPILPVTVDFLRLPGPGFVAQNRGVWIFGRISPYGLPAIICPVYEI